MKMVKNLSALFLLILSLSVGVFAAEDTTTNSLPPTVIKSTTLPDWFPNDAPAPDPHGEIVSVYW